jgi:hypothetical protein
MAKFTLIAGLPVNYEELVADRANPITPRWFSPDRATANRPEDQQDRSAG